MPLATSLHTRSGAGAFAGPHDRRHPAAEAFCRAPARAQEIGSQGLSAEAMAREAWKNPPPWPCKGPCILNSLQGVAFQDFFNPEFDNAPKLI